MTRYNRARAVALCVTVGVAGPLAAFAFTAPADEVTVITPAEFCQECADKNGPGRGPGFYFNPTYFCSPNGDGTGTHEVRFNNSKGTLPVDATVNGVTKRVAPGKTVSFTIPFDSNVSKVVSVTISASGGVTIPAKTVELPCPCDVRVVLTTVPTTVVEVPTTVPASTVGPGTSVVNTTVPSRVRVPNTTVAFELPEVK